MDSVQANSFFDASYEISIRKTNELLILFQKNVTNVKPGVCSVLNDQRMMTTYENVYLLRRCFQRTHSEGGCQLFMYCFISAGSSYDTAGDLASVLN